MGNGSQQITLQENTQMADRYKKETNIVCVQGTMNGNKNDLLDDLQH